MKAMIIDDDRQIREGIRRAINWNALGFEVVECYANGEEALRAFPKLLPDLMVCDIEMPKMNGLELGERIRQYQMDTRIIYLTAFSDFEYCRSAMQLGTEDYILKPVKINSLIRTIEKNVKKLNEIREKDFCYHYSLLQDLAAKIYILGKSGLEEELFSLIRKSRRGFETAYLQTMILEIDSINCFESREFVEFQRELENRNCVMLPYQMNRKICLSSGFHSCLYNMNYRFQLQTEIASWNDYNQGTGYYLKAGISQVHQGKELLTGFKQAKEALADGFYNQKVINIYEGKAKDTEVEMLKQEFREQGKKIRELAGNQDELEEALRLHAETAYKMHLSQEQFQREYLKIYSGISEQMHFINEGEQLYERLSGCDSVQECIKEFREYIYYSIMLSYSKLKKKTTQYSPVIDKAVGFIDAHYQESLSISRVAEYVGKSDNHFSMIFKKETGLSFTEYITRFRIEKACHLLRYTTKQVKEICSEVGMPDYLYFSKIFKKVMGCTPSDVRNELRAESFET